MRKYRCWWNSDFNLEFNILKGNFGGFLVLGRSFYISEVCNIFKSIFNVFKLMLIL